MADSNPFSELKGIPIDYLISTPLMSAARSNMALAQVLVEFVNEIGFDKDGKANLVTFDLTRPYQDPTTKEMKTETIKVEAPLLGLVPIPSLLIQNVDIDLTVQVSTTMSNTTTTQAKAKASYSDDWGFGSVSVSGSFSTKSTHKRSSNQSATYDVKVKALQQQRPEGMSKLMDVMASCIKPIPTDSGSS